MIEKLEDALLSFFLKCLPLRYRLKLQSRPGFDAVFRSVLHLISEKGVRLSIGLFTYALVVRHLGPYEFGRYSWLLNFVTMFLPLVQYGLDEIVTRDIVRAKENLLLTREILWSALVVKAVNAILGVVLMIVVASSLRKDDTALVWMVGLYGLAYVWRALEASDLLFQARLDVRRLTLSRNASYIISSVLKIVGVWSQKATGFFVFLSGLEYFLGRLIMVFAYRKEWKELKPKVSLSYVKSLYREAFPQFLTLALFAINDRIAVLALGSYVGDESVGLYNAAAGLLDIWNFLPLALSASLFPPIVRAHGKERSMYLSRTQRFFDVMIWIGLTLSIFLTFAGESAVSILFGQKYLATYPVLKVLVWYQPLAFFHMARLKWFALEGRLKELSMVAVVTVLLNGYFLWQWAPVLGATGAAWAVVLSSAFAPWLCSLVSKGVKENMQIFIRSLSFPLRIVRGQA